MKRKRVLSFVLKKCANIWHHYVIGLDERWKVICDVLRGEISLSMGDSLFVCEDNKAYLQLTLMNPVCFLKIDTVWQIGVEVTWFLTRIKPSFLVWYLKWKAIVKDNSLTKVATSGVQAVFDWFMLITDITTIYCVYLISWW